jgi:hypothetical protein
MKELLRTIVAAVIGGTVAVAVVVGQPALASQVHAKSAAKNSVTSKAIKNGTIQGKDLNPAINASLAKAGSALQSVPANSVTANEVKNGSLTAGDIGIATGSLTFDAAPIAGGGLCSDSAQIETGKVLDNTIILVEGPFDVMGAVHTQAKPVAAGGTKFVIQVCDTGGAFDPPNETYTWAVIGG